jgi:hypothetical protein
MEPPMTTVDCGQCRGPLPGARSDDLVSARRPCASCGSITRQIRVWLTETLTFEEHLSMHSKHPRPDYKGGRRSKPAFEHYAGDSLTRRDGIWRDRGVLIDRRRDWYEETIYNLDGSIYLDKAEPLSKHVGHGSARRPRLE